MTWWRKGDTAAQRAPGYSQLAFLFSAHRALHCFRICDVFWRVCRISEPPWGHPMAAAIASHASENAAFTAKIRSHMLLAWANQADMRKSFRNILHSLVRRTAVLTVGILPHCVRQDASSLYKTDSFSPYRHKARMRTDFYVLRSAKRKNGFHPLSPPRKKRGGFASLFSWWR